MSKQNPTPKNTPVKNRFSGIVDATRAREQQSQPAPQSQSNADASHSQNPKRRGKSSNSEFLQVSAYLRKDTHKNARKLLMDDEHGRDLSDLLQELLQDWVNKQS